MKQRGKGCGCAGWLILLAAALQSGCAELPPSPAPPLAAMSPALSLKQVMEWVIDPAADAVWESVKIIITEKGTQEAACKVALDVRAGSRHSITTNRYVKRNGFPE